MSLGQKTPTQTCHKRQCLLQDLSSSLQPYRGSWLVLNEGRTKTLPGQLDLILVVWAKPIFAGGRAGARWGGWGNSNGWGLGGAGCLQERAAMFWGIPWG